MVGGMLQRVPLKGESPTDILIQEKERYDEAERNLRLLHVSPDGEGERLVQAEMIQIRYQIESEKVRFPITKPFHGHYRLFFLGRGNILLAYLYDPISLGTCSLLYHYLDNEYWMWHSCHLKLDASSLQGSRIQSKYSAWLVSRVGFHLRSRYSDERTHA